MGCINFNLLRRYTFLLKLPRNYGIFFLKEEKEEVWEDNPAGSQITQILDLLGLEFRKSSSLIFLFPTDFTDTHRLLTYGVQADLQSAFKKCPNLFGICGFAIISG